MSLAAIDTWDGTMDPPGLAALGADPEYGSLPPAGKMERLNKLHTQWADRLYSQDKTAYGGHMRVLEQDFATARREAFESGLREDFQAGNLNEEEVGALIKKGYAGLDGEKSRYAESRYGRERDMDGPYTVQKTLVRGADGKPVGYMHHRSGHEPRADGTNPVEVSWTINGKDGQFSGTDNVDTSTLLPAMRAGIAEKAKSKRIALGPLAPIMGSGKKEAEELDALTKLQAADPAGFTAEAASALFNKQAQENPEISGKLGQGFWQGLPGQAAKGFLKMGAAATHGIPALFGSREASDAYQEGVTDIESDFAGQSRLGFRGGFWDKVAMGVSEEILPMAVSMGASVGAAATRRGATALIERKAAESLAKLTGAQSLETASPVVRALSGGFGKWVGTAKIEGKLAQNLADRVTNAISFLPSSMRSGLDNMAQTFDAAEAARAAGDEGKAQELEDRAVLNMWAGTAIETLSENLWLNEMMLTRAGRSFGDVATSVLSRRLGDASKMQRITVAMKDAVGKMLLAGGQEGAEEVVAGVGGRAWMNAFAEQNQDLFADIPVEFTTGAMLGGLMGAGKALAQDGKPEMLAELLKRGLADVDGEAAASFQRVTGTAPEVAGSRRTGDTTLKEGSPIFQGATFAGGAPDNPFSARPPEPPPAAAPPPEPSPPPPPEPPPPPPPANQPPSAPAGVTMDEAANPAGKSSDAPFTTWTQPDRVHVPPNAPPEAKAAAETVVRVSANPDAETTGKALAEIIGESGDDTSPGDRASATTSHTPPAVEVRTGSESGAAPGDIVPLSGPPQGAGSVEAARGASAVQGDPASGRGFEPHESAPAGIDESAEGGMRSAESTNPAPDTPKTLFPGKLGTSKRLERAPLHTGETTTQTAPDRFEIRTASGAAVTGYFRNQDFPGQDTKPDRAELFFVNVPAAEQRKGVGKGLAIDALRLLEKNGAKTVNMNATTPGGKALVASMLKDGLISGPIQTSATGKAEYFIGNPPAAPAATTPTKPPDAQKEKARQDRLQVTAPESRDVQEPVPTAKKSPSPRPSQGGAASAQPVPTGAAPAGSQKSQGKAVDVKKSGEPPSVDTPVEAIIEVEEEMDGKAPRTQKEIKALLREKIEKVIASLPEEIPMRVDAARIKSGKREFTIVPEYNGVKSIYKVRENQLGGWDVSWDHPGKKVRPLGAVGGNITEATQRAKGLIENDLRPEQNARVIIRIPGDGTFTLRKSRGTLMEMLDRVKGLPTSISPDKVTSRQASDVDYEDVGQERPDDPKELTRARKLALEAAQKGQTGLVAVYEQRIRQMEEIQNPAAKPKVKPTPAATVPDEPPIVDTVTADPAETKAAKKAVKLPETSNQKLKVQREYLLDALDNAIAAAPDEGATEFGTGKMWMTQELADDWEGTTHDFKDRPEDLKAGWAKIPQEDLDAKTAEQAEWDKFHTGPFDDLFAKYQIPAALEEIEPHLDMDANPTIGGQTARAFTLPERMERLRKTISAANHALLPRVEIEVPGDGTFTPVNTKTALREMRALVEKRFPKTVPRPERTVSAPRVNPTPITPLTKPKTPLDAVKLAAVVASTDDSRYVLHFVRSDGKTLVATDGMRLVVLEAKAQGTEQAPVYYHAHQKLSTKEWKKEHTYPNWQQVLPSKGSLTQAHEVADSAGLMKMLIQAKEIAQEDRDSVTLTFGEDGALAVSAHDVDVGDFYGGPDIPAPKLRAAFRADYLIDAIKIARSLGQEKITIRYKDEANPFLIEAKGMKYVVMPFRVNEGGVTATRTAVEKTVPASVPAKPAPAAPVADKGPSVDDVRREQYQNQLQRVSRSDYSNAPRDAARTGILIGKTPDEVYEDLLDYTAPEHTAEAAVQGADKSWRPFKPAWEPVIKALNALHIPGKVELDDAGMPIRGGDVYRKALDGKFTPAELKSARRWLMRHKARGYLADMVEMAQPVEVTAKDAEDAEEEGDELSRTVREPSDVSAEDESFSPDPFDRAMQGEEAAFDEMAAAFYAQPDVQAERAERQAAAEARRAAMSTDEELAANPNRVWTQAEFKRTFEDAYARKDFEAIHAAIVESDKTVWVPLMKEFMREQGTDPVAAAKLEWIRHVVSYDTRPADAAAAPPPPKPPKAKPAPPPQQQPPPGGKAPYTRPPPTGERKKEPPHYMPPPRIPVKPITGGKAKSPFQIMDDYGKAIGKSLRILRHKKSTLGTYRTGTTTTALKFASDMDTFAHELAGHYQDDKYGIGKPWMNKVRSPYDGELAGFWPHGSPSASKMITRAEGIAEVFRAYVMDPDATKKQAPKFWAYVEKTLPKPAMAALDQLSVDVRTWAGEDLVRQGSLNIRMEGPSWLERQREAIMGDGREFPKTLADKMHKWFDDSFHYAVKGWRIAMKMRGKNPDTVPVEENLDRMLRILSGHGERFKDQLDFGLVPFNQQLEAKKDAAGNAVIDNATGLPAMRVVRLIDPVTGEPMTRTWLFDPYDASTEENQMADARDAAGVMVAQRVNNEAEQIDAKAAARIRLAPHLKDSILAEAEAEKRKTFSGQSAGMGQTDVQKARDILAALESGDLARKARILEGARRYRLWADTVLQNLVDSGRKTPEEIAQIRRENSQYVNMQRLSTYFDAAAAMHGTGKSPAQVEEIIKPFLGSGLEIGNVFSNAFSQGNAIQKEALRNKTVGALVHSIEGARKLYQGESVELDKIGRKVSAHDRNTVPYWRNGVEEHWQFDEDIYEALKGVSDLGSHPIVDLLAKPQELMRYLITHSPAFPLRNVPRDIGHRVVTSQSDSKPWDVLRGYDQDLKSIYMLFGGGQSIMASEQKTKFGNVFEQGMREARRDRAFTPQSRLEWVRDIKRGMHELAKDPRNIILLPGQLKRGWERFVQSSEIIGRVAEMQRAYKKYKARGLSDVEAWYAAVGEARDLMDFAKAGSVMRQISRLIPFSNAHLRGLGRSLYAIKEDPGGVALKFSMYLLLPTVAVMAFGHRSDEDEEEYTQLPSWQRDHFWNLKVGNTWFRIPKPHELGVMAGGVERALEKGLYARKHAFEGFGNSTQGALSPVGSLADLTGPLKVPIEIMTNRDFFRDRDIIPPWERDLKLEKRKGRIHASGSGQTVAGGLNAVFGSMFETDPRQIDHFLRSYGGLGQMFTDFTSANMKGTDAAKRATGYTAFSPGAQSVDYQFVMDWARLNGETGNTEIKALHRMVDPIYKAENTEAADKAARQLRLRATKLRGIIEKREARGKKD